MAKKIINSVKLGAFVLAGLIFLVVMLYMIGKNQNLFGDTYKLKARFENIQGLVEGNNVRFAGIQAGTVKNINILNDTVIEVTMLVVSKMKTIIRKNAVASIGTEGLVGNKVVNIVPAPQPTAFAVEGDILAAKKGINTDDILQSLNKTSTDVAAIAGDLKTTIRHINNSSGLWALLNDQSISKEVKIALANLRMATGRAYIFADDLAKIIDDTKNGKGLVGALLNDTSIMKNLKEGLSKIKSVGEKADSLVTEVNSLVEGIQNDLNSGKGPANAVLNDSMMVIKFNKSLDNIQKGTEAFNQNMEALKHNFWLRGYFKKMEKQKEKELQQQTNTKDAKQ